jgi:glyoxylase-like metal-dependent hydrolase (beta-lactamase superfamily II)
VYVHHRGAPHVVDPSRLLASARRVYGNSLEDLWGRVVPAPTDRVVPVSDGDMLDLEGLRIQALDAPGHASHHIVYVLDGLAFTGDAAGVRLPGPSLVDLPAPPPEFDREAWYGTIARLEAMRLQALFPTHFGRIDDVTAHLQGLRSVIAEGSGFVRGMLVAGADRDAMVREYLDWSRERMRAAGIDQAADARYELANPFEMSVDGLARYWRKRGVGATPGDGPVSS